MKDTTIIFRTTSKEKQGLELEAKEKNMTVSQLIRSKINTDISSNVSMPGTVYIESIKLCNLMTEIQRLKMKYPEISIEEVENEAGKLWQV